MSNKHKTLDIISNLLKRTASGEFDATFKQQYGIDVKKYNFRECPFCGSVANVDYAIYPEQQNQSYTYFSKRYSVRCYWNGSGKGCGAESGHFKTKAEAREHWNIRV